jgi:tRNA G37 N-methylase Trm5
MQLSNIDFEENEITVDLGYRGELRLVIKFNDQNNNTHRRNFFIRIYGENPTEITVERESNIIYRSHSDSSH